MDCNKFSWSKWIFSEEAAANAIALKHDYEQKRLSEFNMAFKTDFAIYHPLMAYESLQSVNFQNRPGGRPFFDRQSVREIESAICNTDGVVQFAMMEENTKSTFNKQALEPFSDFEKRLMVAFNDLQDLGGPYSTLLSGMTDAIFPIRPVNQPLNVRFLFSAHELKGVIFVHYNAAKDTARPVDAIDLFHEIGHQVLMYYLLADDVITSDPNTMVFSGARNIARPAYRSLHSAFALAYMAIAADGLLCCKHFQNETALLSAKLELYRSGLTNNLESLRKMCTFSELGNLMMHELEQINFITGG